MMEGVSAPVRPQRGEFRVLREIAGREVTQLGEGRSAGDRSVSGVEEHRLARLAQVSPLLPPIEDEVIADSGEGRTGRADRITLLVQWLGGGVPAANGRGEQHTQQTGSTILWPPTQ